MSKWTISVSLVCRILSLDTGRKVRVPINGPEVTLRKPAWAVAGPGGRAFDTIGSPIVQDLGGGQIGFFIPAGARVGCSVTLNFGGATSGTTFEGKSSYPSQEEFETVYLPRWEAGVESRHLGARASNASLNARLAKGTSEAFEALGQLAEGLQKAGIAFSFEGTQGAGHLRVKIVEDRPDLLVLAPRGTTYGTSFGGGAAAPIHGLRALLAFVKALCSGASYKEAWRKEIERRLAPVTRQLDGLEITDLQEIGSSRPEPTFQVVVKATGADSFARRVALSVTDDAGYSASLYPGHFEARVRARSLSSQRPKEIVAAILEFLGG